MVKTIILSLLLLHCNQPATAQNLFQNTEERKRIKAIRITQPIKIDGQLNEDSWQLADTSSSFIQIEPVQGRTADFQTRVKILYDNKSLYIGAFCYDYLGKRGIRVTQLKRDFSALQNDVFGFCMDAFNDKRNNVTFITNPYGPQSDYISFDGGQIQDNDWNGLWKVRTYITDTGWAAEFEIPWKTLRYKKSDTAQAWGINFYRSRRLSNETSAWSPYPRSFNLNRMEFGGQVSDLQPPPPSANVQATPYTLSSYTKSKKDGLSLGKTKLKTGGDIKWAINSNNILDVTINTDFAQADADIAINNITRFSVLFPERRQFFLENSSFFSPGLNGTGGSMYLYPFFSRTIGLNNGNPVPIDAGTRFVHRSSKTNYGAMVIRQAETENSPLTHFAIARYSRNFSGQNRIGGLLTTKSVSRTGTAASYNNITGSIDGFFRFDKANSLKAMTILSSNSSTNKKGFAGYAQYQYTTNAVQAWLTETIITKGYTNEMGFISREDVISTSPGFFTNLRGKWLPFKKWIRAVQPDIAAEFYHQASTGKLIESSVAIYPLWVSLHSGGFFGYSITPTYQNLSEDFSPLGITISRGMYRYNRSTFYVNSDPSKKISYSIIHDIGRYFDGRLTSTTGSLACVPIPHISLKFSLSRNNFENIGIKDSSAVVSLYTFEGRFALNPRLQLNNLLQYNTQSKLSAGNIRLSWEYKPLSYLYIVYNLTRKPVSLLSSKQQEQALLIKLSFLKQF